MFKYETHLHTIESSRCGSTSAAEYPAYYKSLGYSGIFITDHFFNGNCRISNDLPWEDRVNMFCRSYELAKEAGDAIDFPVFFGWEANFDGDEFLIYGLDKKWLLGHPDIMSYSRAENDRLYGMEFDTPLSNEGDYVKRILNREGHIAVPNAHRVPDNYTIETKLPVVTNHR